MKSETTFFFTITNKFGAAHDTVISVEEAHELHDQLTTFINNNPLPDEED